jgi:predicted Zn-dependent protease
MGVLTRLGLLTLALFLGASVVVAQDLPAPLAERFGEAVAALKAGDLAAAERGLRDVLARGGDRAFVRHNLGIALQEGGRHADAVVEFRAAARLDPSFGPARLLAGSSLLALGRTRDAVAELERAVALMPSDASAHVQLAAACERAGDAPCVAREARALSGLAPRDPELLYQLGRAYLRLAQWSYERIRAIDPKSARLSQALGRELAEQGRVDEAIRAFAEAGARDPRLPGIHLALAQLLASRQQWDEALDAIDRELALAPANAAARDLRAQIEAARIAPPQP